VSEFVGGLLDATTSANNSQDQSESNLQAITKGFEIIRTNCTQKESEVIQGRAVLMGMYIE